MSSGEQVIGWFTIGAGQKGADADKTVNHAANGDTVWHLWLHDPELCQRHLAPLCELLGMSMPWTQFTQALDAIFDGLDPVQQGILQAWREYAAQLQQRYAL